MRCNAVQLVRSHQDWVTGWSWAPQDSAKHHLKRCSAHLLLRTVSQAGQVDDRKGSGWEKT